MWYDTHRDVYGTYWCAWTVLQQNVLQQNVWTGNTMKYYFSSLYWFHGDNIKQSSALPNDNRGQSLKTDSIKKSDVATCTSNTACVLNNIRLKTDNKATLT